MRRKSLTLAAFLFGILWSGLGIAQAAMIDDLIARFEGQYRGEVLGSEVGRPTEGTLVMHTFVRGIEAPAFGDNIVYLEQRYGGPEGSITRQRIFAFNEDRQGVVTTAYDFPDGAKYARSDAVPQRLAALTPDDMYSFPEGCRIRWSKENNTYVGAVKRTDCRIESRGGRGDVFVDMVYRLPTDAYTLFEQGFNASDIFLFGTATAHVHKRLPKKDLDAEADRILAAFEGAFENRPVVNKDGNDNLRIGGLYTQARRVDLPAFGTRVMYLESAQGGLGGDVKRQRIISFDDDPERTANVMLSYTFTDSAAFVGAHKNPKMLSGLTPADMGLFPTGCEMIWGEQTGVLVGNIHRTTCILPNENPGKSRHITFEYMLDGESMHLWEAGYTPGGMFSFGTLSGLRFPRVRDRW